MENTVSGLDGGGHLSDNLHRVGMGSHAKLERQGSKGSKGCPTPSRKVHSPLGSRVDTDKQSDDLHGLLSIVSLRPLGWSGRSSLSCKTDDCCAKM